MKAMLWFCWLLKSQLVSRCIEEVQSEAERKQILLPARAISKECQGALKKLGQPLAVGMDLMALCLR